MKTTEGDLRARLTKSEREIHTQLAELRAMIRSVHGGTLLAPRNTRPEEALLESLDVTVTEVFAELRATG